MLYRILATVLSILAYWSIFPVPVQAGRYVLNQSFETVESYFGPHLVETSRQQGSETWTTRTYSNVGVRQSLPNLPANAQFKIIFVNGKAQWIVLAPGSGDSIPVEDSE